MNVEQLFVIVKPWKLAIYGLRYKDQALHPYEQWLDWKGPLYLVLKLAILNFCVRFWVKMAISLADIGENRSIAIGDGLAFV